MKKLFIIGNGFDISHNLRTKYSDFQKYLNKNYPNALKESWIVPESFVMPDGDEGYDDDEVVGFLLKVITEAEATGEAWSDLENSLGRLDFSDYFDSFIETNNEENEWHEVYINEDIAHNIKGAVMPIKQYFSD